MRMTMLLFLLSAVYAGCRQRKAALIAEAHLVTIRQPGEELYIDRLDKRVIIQKEDAAGPTTFCAFLIGLKDSLPVMDAARKQELEKYWQYTMQQDWTVIVDGDSVKPVFMQEKPTLKKGLRESALVFEVPRGHSADTLVYRDTYSNWGTRLFVLK